MNKIETSIRTLLLTVVAVIATSSAAAADTITFSSTTSGAPTFNRPVDTGTALSSVGTAVPYSIFQFSVGAAGPHTFLSIATTPGYDPFLILYRNSFNPATPLTNFLFANDDFPPGNLTQSGFTLSLTTGINYFLVQTGFENTDFGNFTTVIGGPGAIIPVPEPATLVLLGSGIIGVAVRVRKRRSTHEDTV
ncbi:MAG: PEP-CTERM sorting domain-containing protein [Pyrinomonadaceae bacterium]|nr:PEP-CTERM sorting domain-containing protein [Pyrinomonadaceae bacterium]